MAIRPLSDNDVQEMSVLNRLQSIDVPTPKLSNLAAASMDSYNEDVEVEPASSQSTRSTWRMTTIVVALLLCLFVAALDATIVATAVPTITRDLNSASGYTWVGGAYLLANAATGPIWAKFSDIWGRKMIVLLALAVFFVASLACAVAQTMRVLIAARAVQGAAAGGLILLVHICISDLFSLRQRSLLMSLTEFVWALAAGIGPVLGGVFASLVSWRWCFYINLPICGIAFILILRFLDVRHEHTSFKNGLKAVDWAGVTTFLAFTVMLLLGLDFGGAIFPWSSAKVIALIVIGALMSLAFVYSEARLATYPIIPLGLFKQRSNVASLLVTFFHGAVHIAGEYYLPLYFQSVLNASPLTSGILLLPFVTTTALAGMLAGFLIHRTGRFCEVIWIGCVFITISSGLFILLNASSTRGPVIGFQIILGVGSGLLFEPPLIAVQSQVKQDDVATATSTLTFIRNIALTISIVLGATVFQNSMDLQASALRRSGLPESILNQLSGKNAEANVMLAASLSNNLVQQQAVKQAFAVSIRNMWILYTVLGFCGVLSSVFIRRAHLSTDHVETVTGIRGEKVEPVVAPRAPDRI